MSLEQEADARQEKTVSTSINIWYEPRTQSIHLVFKDFDLITTVSEKPGLKRCHAHLFGHLRTILQKEGKWPGDSTT